MRYVFGFLCVGALVGTLPQSVHAQAGEKAAPKLALAIHAQHRLPPQLMVQASYYRDLEADTNNGAASGQTEPHAEAPKSALAEEAGTAPDIRPQLALLLIPEHLQQRIPGYRRTKAQQPKKQPQSPEPNQRSQGARIGIAVGVSVLVVGAALGIAAAATAASIDF